MEGVEALYSTLRRYLPASALPRIKQAYEVAERAHRGSLRRSGEPYITHPVAVARILAELKLDPDAIMAGLLHDTVEDTPVTLDDIERQFGRGVRDIVEGETKISKLAVRRYEDEQSENLRQMFVAMANDLRIIIVKLADRLHNMRTLESMPAHKQQQIARETLEIFAPLAHRLGIGQIKWELEDLAFRYLEPEAHAMLEAQLAGQRLEREELIKRASGVLLERLRAERIKFEVSGRAKHLYSIFKKMERQGKALEQIFDLLALRVLVETKTDCYQALGVVHTIWTPIPGRFKDYIAVPKPNGYQSLHTTVISVVGQPLEVQIRTQEMHRIAEYGIAAHWLYKEGIGEQEFARRRLKWIEQLMDFQHEISGSGEFVSAVKEDLLGDRVFVFTPKGDTVNLPKGATPIDFAYHVHTEVGHRCMGAKVNGHIVPLDYQLVTGDRVEIMLNRSPGAGPSKDWLNIATTRSARQKIRSYFRFLERAERVEFGKRMLERALKRAELPVAKVLKSEALVEAAEALTRARDPDELYLALDSGRVHPRQVVDRLAPTAPAATPGPRAPARPAPELPRPPVFVQSLETAMVKLAACCKPVRGDEIIGYITRGRGVSVHRVNCPNVRGLLKEPDRCVSVSWTPGTAGQYLVDLEVLADDRPGLLKDVLDVVAKAGKSATKVEASVGAGGDHGARITVRFAVGDYGELEQIRHGVSGVRGVTRARRLNGVGR
jgi:GTP pyrophosphokinase